MSRIGAGLSLLLLVVPLTGYAQPVVVETIELVDQGVYDVEIARRIHGGGSLDGIRNIIGRARILERTTSVPARACVSFGFSYVIAGSPVGAKVPLRMVTRFPAQGIRNPQTGITAQVSEDVVVRTIGAHHLRVFTFEQSWESVPGLWTLEIWHKDHKLAERSFWVSHAGASDCGDRCDAHTCAAISAAPELPPATGPFAAIVERG